ncbi:hypothetical protein ACFRI7_11750 [Streptomyces sp. NPDC056716]|uniref:hypothetical protein n=1 Tax=unclassified Streptomyces TaxID=2593676 RepID=UPI0036B51289
MTRHLVSTVPIGWDTLGTDLLDRTPDNLRAALTAGIEYPSTDLDDLITPDGSPPPRIAVTSGESLGATWGYVLHPEGIEVIAATEHNRGPLVGWDTHPLSRISDSPARWTPGQPAPVITPPPVPRLTTSATDTTGSTLPSHRAARR